MTSEKRNDFINRILSVQLNDKAKFGKMNVSQMICHCADQFRMLFGEIEGLRRQNVDLVKFKEMAARNETLPTVDGLDQAAGGGTKPTELENDKELLIDYLKRFSGCPDNYNFSFHPYLGVIGKEQWERLVIHHLEHHLSQFKR